MSFLNPIWHAPARTCSVITNTCMGWGRLHSSTLVFVTRLCPASPHSPSLLHSVFALNHITPSPHISHPLTGIIFPLVSEDTVPSGSPEVFPSPSLAYTLPSQSWVVYSLFSLQSWNLLALVTLATIYMSDFPLDWEFFVGRGSVCHRIHTV